MVGQVRNPDAGQDEKTHVVGDAGQPALAGRFIPANKSVATGNAPGCGAIEQASQQTILAVVDQILQILTDRTTVTQMVVLLQECAKQLHLGCLGGQENPKGLKISEAAFNPEWLKFHGVLFIRTIAKCVIG